MKTYFFRLALLVSITFRVLAESDTTLILDGVTNHAGELFVLGDTGPSNFLLITNGGVLTDADGVVGYNPAARSNLGVVTGVGSLWTSSRSLLIGATGALNQVSILAGGRAGVGQSAVLGVEARSTNNVLLINGPGSVFDNIYLYLGVEGSGNRLIVTNGGRLNGNNSRDTADVVGYWQTATENQLLLTGAGTTGRLDNVAIGMNGARNHLRIDNGARLLNSSVGLGVQETSVQNSALATGAGSVWSVLGSLSVGSRGPSNLLSVEDGARVDSAGGGLGSFTTSTNNSAVITGTGTVWNASGEFNLGRAGSGNRLLVAGGGSFQAGTLYVGNQSSRNRLLVLPTGGVRADAILVGGTAEANGNEIQLDGAAGTRPSCSMPAPVGATPASPLATCPVRTNWPWPAAPASRAAPPCLAPAAWPWRMPQPSRAPARLGISPPTSSSAASAI
jgi:T5SS/PEP-CTERM-associated repeat protein